MLHNVILSATLIAMTTSAIAADIVAHRGASHDAPENTVAAFMLGWQQNADVFECDIRLTKDNKIICIHDATTDRTTGHKAKVIDLTLDEHRKLDAGTWKSPKYAGERLPTIEEILASVPPGKRILIEVKVGPNIVPILKQAIEASRVPLERLAIISFNDKVVAAARESMPTVETRWIFNFKQENGKWNLTPDEALRRARECKAHGIAVGVTGESGQFFTAEFVKQFREQKLSIHVWTVNDVELAKRMLKLGVDSITTDRPGWLRQELGK